MKEKMMKRPVSSRTLNHYWCSASIIYKPIILCQWCLKFCLYQSQKLNIPNAIFHFNMCIVNFADMFLFCCWLDSPTPATQPVTSVYLVLSNMSDTTLKPAGFKIAFKRCSVIYIYKFDRITLISMAKSILLKVIISFFISHDFLHCTLQMLLMCT